MWTIMEANRNIWRLRRSEKTLMEMTKFSHLNPAALVVCCVVQLRIVLLDAQCEVQLLATIRARGSKKCPSFDQKLMHRHAR